MSKKRINVAIDGPAGAGKSTIAKLFADRVHYNYVDTGAMFRAVTWYLLQENLNPEQTEEIQASLKNLNLKWSKAGISVNEIKVAKQIRSNEVTKAVSSYAELSCIREKLLHMQQQMAGNKGIVMDGRDIGTTVLKDAELKVFLTASIKARAERRYYQLTEESRIPLEQLEEEIQKRDQQDAERDLSPLRQADDAILIDTTDFTVSEVIKKIMRYFEQVVNG